MPWAIFLKRKVPKSNSNENSATNFKAWSCKICHNLHDLYTTGIRIRHVVLYNHYHELEDVKSKNRPLGNQTLGPCVPQARLCTNYFHAVFTFAGAGHVAATMLPAARNSTQLTRLPGVEPVPPTKATAPSKSLWTPSARRVSSCSLSYIVRIVINYQGRLLVQFSSMDNFLKPFAQHSGYW